ncbi:ATP-binding cassette domain-containing protein [bacterium]|nr:ATP-binding cassette domain-containing protein [bacterium]
MNVIEVQNLRKIYTVPLRREGILGSIRDLFHREHKAIEAVKDISFSVAQGEVLGYIGQNGAGKSTTIKMMSGILVPSSGSINVLGFNPSKERKLYTKHIGAVFGQRTQLWWDIALIESFHLLKRIYQVPEREYSERLQLLSEILNLTDLFSVPVRKLSLGQRMRGELAASLLHGPKVLFLDEPTIGLDEVGKHNVRSFLRAINRDFNTTIILTTHDLTEIEELCKRVIIIDEGSAIFSGSLDSLKNLPGFGRRVIFDFAEDAPQEELKKRFPQGVIIEQQGERRLVCSIDSTQLNPIRFVQQISEAFPLVDLTVTEPAIEDVVMKIYQQGQQVFRPEGISS